MKNYYILLFSLFFSASLISAPGDTTWVTAHHKTDMVWWNYYSDTASFPDGSKSYHKILMYYTMGCATGGCSPWDYTTRVILRQATGVMDSNVASIDTISTSPLVIDTTWNVFEAKEPFELARVITPYGGNLSNNWEHDFVYDVTDYAPLLRNDVEIALQYQGWSSGFSGTVRFAFIEGTPAREVISVQNLYHGHGNYINSNDFENDHLPSRSVSIDPATTGLLLRANFSGHGFVNSLNCAEFCEKDYYVKVNGTQVATQAIWRDDCGLNPIWPQAGTWLYDRANWCPGDKSLFREHDLTASLTTGTMDIDVDIEPYTYTVPPNEVPANYNYAVQLFQFKSPAHQHDVELERIIAPSSEDEFARINPVCSGALVRIRNKGAQTLTSCEIGYGMDGGTWKIFNWTGSLEFMESAIVELPFGGASDWMTYKTEKNFVAIATKPNGQYDENDKNNWYDTKITPTTVYPSAIKMTLRTNNASSETHWKIIRLDDQTTVASGDNLSNGTTYNESLNLSPGCYLFHLEDRGKDGLSFPFNNDGNGSCRIQNDGGAFFIKVFDPNFGTEIKEYFTVGYGIGVDEQEFKTFVDVYPNPTSDYVTIDIAHQGKSTAKLQLIAVDGRTVLQQTTEVNDELQWKVDLQHLPKGLYTLQLEVGKTVQTKKIVVE